MNSESVTSTKPQQWITPSDAIPPLSAATAIFPFPICYGLAFKNARQLDTGLPSAQKVFLNSFKIAPVFGLIVGIQMFSKRVFDKYSEGKIDEQWRSSPFYELAGSSVGALASIYPLAGVNALFSGENFFKSMKNLSLMEGSATFARETLFVLSLSLSTPLSKKMKSIYGDTEIVEYRSAAASGAIGSICGHPFDTMLTRWQNGKKIESIKQLPRGLVSRAICVATFAMCYNYMQKMFKEKITPAEKE